METGMIVISTILIIICTVPFILIYGSTKKREKQLKKALDAGIAQNNGYLTDYEINNNFALGLDNNTKQIYFYKSTPEAEYIQKINLNEIHTCGIEKKTKRITNGPSNNEIVQSIALVFTSTKSNAVEQFKLYDYDDSSQPNGEMDVAETWKQKIDDLLPTNTAISKEQNREKAPLEFV